jgi:hypothetical protein
MGRPSKFTPAMRERVLNAVSMGMYLSVAARYAGISPASLYRYLAGSTPEHIGFRKAIREAAATCELRWVATVYQASLTDPHLALKLLERRHPERWGPRARTEETGDPLGLPGPAPNNVVIFDPALAESLLPRLLEAGQRRRAVYAGQPVDVGRFADHGRPSRPMDDEDS